MRYLKTYEGFDFQYSYDKRTMDNYMKSAGATSLTDEDVSKVISLLERDCPKFLEEIKTKEQPPLFRGTYGSINDIEEVIARKDRIPKDMNIEFSNIFNSIFKSKFGVAIRREGVFASKSPYVCEGYGQPKMFFPIGDYKYFWNPDVEDLHTYVDDKLSFGNGWDDEDDAIDDEEEFLYEVAEGYREGGLENITKQEITFVCDKYYLVNPIYYERICEYLQKK